jgi:hypothetical protein
MAEDYEDSKGEELLEDSEYSRKSEFSKAAIVSAHVTNILTLRSEDMRPGYTTWLPDKSGNIKPVVIPDVRKKYVGAVESLLNFLTPELEVQKTNIKNDYEAEKKNIFNRFAYKERVGKKWNQAKNVYEWDLSGEVYVPQKGTVVLVAEKDFPNSVEFFEQAGGWDVKIDAYWDFMVELADELFCEINNILHKLEYFKGGVGI